MRFIKWFLATTLPLLMLSLAACMVGPNYHEPNTNIMDHWLDANSSSKKKPKICESCNMNRLWWTEFQDPILIDLIDAGYHNNLSLQTAGVHVLQARAELAQATGSLYPQQQAIIGNVNYNRIGGSSLQGLLPSDFYTDTLGFTASWELDFWGKYRRAILSHDATFLASIAAYDGALVTLTADIATTYITFRTTQSLIKTIKANIVVQTLGLKIARSRYQAGQTSLVDVEQAQTELSETEASLPPLVAQLQAQKDALAFLLGTTPNGIESLIATKKSIPKAPRQVGILIPKEALARRPDIFQSRLQAIAQMHAIGAAKANLFPSFSLTGTFVFASNTISGNSLGNIFNSSNLNVVTGPGVNWPILNYGQITNAVRAQDAVFQQSLLQYKELVLKAQKEAQDNITGYIEANKAVQLLQKANYSAKSSLKLALIRYREGETDFTPVLNAEQQQLRVQRSLINAEGDVPKTLVALYRALGGGWEMRGCNDFIADEIKDEMGARTHWGSLLKQKNHERPATCKEQLKSLYLPKW